MKHKTKPKRSGPGVFLGLIAVCGIDHEVYEATPEQDPQMETCFGYCSAGLRRIVVGAGLGPQLFRNTLLHEVLHLIWGHSNVSEIVAALEGDEREETVIRVITPHIVAALASTKKWRAS